MPIFVSVLTKSNYDMSSNEPRKEPIDSAFYFVVGVISGVAILSAVLTLLGYAS